MRFGTEVAACHGDRRLTRLTLQDRETGETDEVPAVALFVLIGGLPRTDWLPATVARDDGGYVLTGPHVPDADGRRSPSAFETSVPGVFAVGDVRRGATKRVASAAGEGAVCVSAVHQHLHGGSHGQLHGEVGTAPGRRPSGAPGNAMNALICGGEIAGLALVLFLEQQGVEARIVERADEFGSVGYGITLWGNDIRILEQLDVDAVFHERGQPIWSWTRLDGEGEELKRMPLRSGGQPPLTAIHRADLHGLLLDRVPRPSIRMSTTVEAVHPALEDVEGVEGVEGVEVQLSGGARERYDLLVGADGVRSRIREMAFDDWELDDTGPVSGRSGCPRTSTSQTGSPKRGTRMGRPS